MVARDDVVLVSMPWQALESPSLPLALLRAVCARERLAVPATYHGGVRWCEHLMTECGDIGVREYTDVAENGLFDGIGDWVFSGVLHDDPEFGVAAFEEYAAGRRIDVGLVRRMRDQAESFVDRAVDDILSHDPVLVGLTTTFMQNVPSLALARRLKRARPGLSILFGGGNCDGVMGTALHRNFDFVDMVVRGEGEEAFPRLLHALRDHDDLGQVPGLCWRDEHGEQRVNQAAAAPVGPDRLPVPDFDDWFELMERSPVAAYVEPQLVVETSRGCWWGEKHQCTFCGLNGSLMAFRAKSPDRAVAEITELVRKHRILDVITVDNIIDNTYFHSMLPRLAELGWDLRIHYEVKSNLTADQIARCKAAGVAHVQPGIESLVAPVLGIMDKGVSGWRNVRTLRDCESASLTVSWNWLYGFPGERAESYAPVVAQLAALRHLQPPANAARILLERFSPYFERPALGFAERSPAMQYRYLYDLPDEALLDMVYLFDTPERGLSETEVAHLRAEIEAWIDAYPNSTLEVVEQDEALVIVDRRAGWPAGEHVIDDPRLVAAYGHLEHGRSTAALVRRLRDEGHDVDEVELLAWTADLRRRGLVFEENGVRLAVATRRAPVKISTPS